MSKILITGANGQLGNEIRVLEKAYPAFKFVYTDVAELDITNPEAIENFVSGQNFNYLINCAAYTAVDKAEEDTDTAYLINEKAVGFLAEACKILGITMIHVSTDYVFDGKKYQPYVESEPTQPDSAYGRSKEAGELAFKKSGVKGAIVRTSWLYSGFGNNFVKTMLRLGKEREELRVIFDQIGTPTNGADLADALLKMVQAYETDKDRNRPTIYHYSNEGVCSWYDFSKEIIDLSGLSCKVTPIETKDYPLPANRPFYSVLNKALIKETFDIAIPHWRDSLILCLKRLNN